MPTVQSTFRAALASVLCIAVACAAPLRAQLARSFPPGLHRYAVNGSYEGIPMQPWAAELEVRDTTLDGDAAIRVVSISTRDDPPGRFTYSTILKRSTLSAVSAGWTNAGQVPSSCAVSIVGGQATGRLHSGAAVTPVSVTGEVIPDFAAGVVLALKSLADGDTIRLTTMRCLPQWDAKAIVTKSLVAIVRSAEASRGEGGTPEPVWQIDGLEPYNMAARIAKRDRQLLSFTIPEGTGGTQTQTFVRTAPP